MPLEEVTLPVHAKHTDGYPICWVVPRRGLFESTWNEAEITCIHCLNYMKE